MECCENRGKKSSEAASLRMAHISVLTPHRPPFTSQREDSGETDDYRNEIKLYFLIPLPFVLYQKEKESARKKDRKGVNGFEIGVRIFDVYFALRRSEKT